MTILTFNLCDTLKRARKAQRLSQLDLGLRLGVSQRHISFVESGRSRPSRALLLSWLEELNMPLVTRNDALLQAGFAPQFGTTASDTPEMQMVNQALDHLLTLHEPMPALILDSEWNLKRMNRGAQWLALELMPLAATLLESGPTNMLDLMAHPEGLTNNMVNLSEVGPMFLTHLRHSAAVNPKIAPKVDAFAALLAQKLGPRNLHTTIIQPISPVLTTRYSSRFGELAFFTMLTTFGTPQDITLASLRVEHMFAADETTHSILTENVGKN